MRLSFPVIIAEIYCAATQFTARSLGKSRCSGRFTIQLLESLIKVEFNLVMGMCNVHLNEQSDTILLGQLLYTSVARSECIIEQPHKQLVRSLKMVYGKSLTFIHSA